MPGHGGARAIARIRTVKPEFFKNEDLHALGPFAAILFEGLWCWADRDGRLEDRPGRLKVEILPYYDCDCNALLDLLDQHGFIKRYEVGGLKLIWIIKFKEHQRITGKEAETPSKFPECPPGNQPSIPEEGEEKHSGNTGETPEMTGRERKGKEDIASSLRSEASAAGREPNHVWDPIARVICQVAEACGWPVPDDSQLPTDVGRYLKAGSPIAQLINAYGEDGAVERFVWIHEHWTIGPSWELAWSKRNQIDDEMLGRRVIATRAPTRKASSSNTLETYNALLEGSEIWKAQQQTA